MSYIAQVCAAYPDAYCGYTDAFDAPQGGRWAIFQSIDDACRSDGRVIARGKSGSAAWRNAAKAVAAHGVKEDGRG
jgi:hypothetical protein